MLNVVEYQTPDGRRPFGEALRALRDREARRRIVARIVRVQAGVRGDWRSVGGGAFELRIDHGPGYRVYCGQDGPRRVLLLVLGDKRTQPQDIERAHAYWKDYQARR